MNYRQLKQAVVHRRKKGREAVRLADRIADEMKRQNVRCVSWGDGLLVDVCRSRMRLKNDHPLNVMKAACNALERAPDRFRKFMMRGHDCNGNARLVRAFELRGEA